ncbi:MAG: cellulose synthase family protein [Acidobacteriota bacterium]
MATSVLALYFLVLGVLALYGLHRLALTWTWWRRCRTRPAGAESPAAETPRAWPTVTVQLPIYNERYVAERLIDAVCALDYPADRLEIQVLDDSDDDTAALVAARVAAQRAAGVDIHHVRRAERSGFKAGALAEGLRQARGELLAVFDADFVPQPEFLRQVVPTFDDPSVGMAQARWGHLNRDYSLLTRVQAILLDAHFVIEHAARHVSGCLFNFNGTAGVWRRRAIDDAGGWQHDTLTEDLDLSYRAQLAGWRFVFLPDVVVPAELPAEVNAFKSQQHRWAKGSIQSGRKLLGAVLRSRLPWRAKLEAMVHLTANGSYLLMLLLSALIFPAMWLRRGDDSWLLLAVDLPLFFAATVSVLIFFAASQSRRAPWWRTLWQLPALMALGIGLAVNNSRAVLSGLVHDGGVFHRTPKFRLEADRADGWAGKAYALGKAASFYLEAALAVYFAVCFVLAVQQEMWWSLPFLWLFLQGYAYMTLLGLRPAGGWRRRPPAEPAAA